MRQSTRHQAPVRPVYPVIAVRQWNEAHAVGTIVVVRKDDGSKVTTRTRSEAWVLGGHSAVVQLEGIAGCYALERVQADGS